MSLRLKLLAMFGAFAVAPLLAIGAIDYVRSMHALEALISAQTSLITERAVGEVRERYQTVTANLTLVASNEETRHILGAPDESSLQSAQVAARPYLDELWPVISDDVRWVIVADSSGRELLSLGDRTTRGPIAPDGETLGIVTALEPRAGAAGPSLSAGIRLARLLPREALATHFGRSGYTAVVDRVTGRVLFGAGHEIAIASAMTTSDSASNLDVAAARPLTFVENDSTRLGSLVNLDEPKWTVVSVASVADFAGPFAANRRANLILVMLATSFAVVAFIVALWRATASLRVLTSAADEVGRGNFAPVLPRPTHDEVGRLGTAFGLMVDKLGIMVREMERSRQMAVVGQFAAQIAHEIRNPLTSIKLNLQQMQRAARRGTMPPETELPLEISLREINRLDRVVHGVLRLGGSRSVHRDVVAIAPLIRRALELTSARAEMKELELADDVTADDQSTILGDAAMIESVILNLLLNAVDASPAGGTIHVSLAAGTDRLRIAVSDDGPGVDPLNRERIFEPFFTTRREGTGLGLALVQRTVEEHGGRVFVDTDHAGSGARFVVELPLAGPEETR